MNLLSLFRRNVIWNAAVYVAAPDFELGQPLGSPAHVFSTKKFWKAIDEPRIAADPFLFVHGDELYMFFEMEPGTGRGRIQAYRTSDLKEFHHLGDILSEPHHLSYPFIFEDEGRIFLVPESFEAGEICLYEFADFPHQPVKRRTLLSGRFVDSSLMRDGRHWYLFTTSASGLELYHSPDLLSGSFTPHPLSPITRDPRYSRCGGGALRWGEGRYRLAQDCLRSYGENLHLFAIEEITPTTYSERLIKANMLERDEDWNSLGGHHMSLKRFRDHVVVAVDGKQHDHYVHKIRGLLRRVAGL